MNIGILTHPQEGNYGGILQCYALNSFLKKLGYNTIVINRGPNDNWLKSILRKILRTLHHPRYYHKGEVDVNINMRPFVREKLHRTNKICSDNKMRRVCKDYTMDAVIVGSDQVWRYDFALNYGYNFFLDFVPNDVLKLSYAASFALPTWKYGAEDTTKIRYLLNKFKAVSVREEDAVALCKENLGIDAEWLLDPTILLDAEEYSQVSSNRLLENKFVFIYWLGDENQAQPIIKKYKDQGYKVVYVSLRANIIKPSIEDWISYIKYADIVHTDSFHGCVFSILFQKHLVPTKSLYTDSRTVSLFKLLGLQMGNIQCEDYNEEVTRRINQAREKSKKFITQNLR